MTQEELVKKLDTAYYGKRGNLKLEWVNYDKYALMELFWNNYVINIIIKKNKPINEVKDILTKKLYWAIKTENPIDVLMDYKLAHEVEQYHKDITMQMCLDFVDDKIQEIKE